MLTLPPVKGEISLAGVLPFAGVGGSSRTRVIVVVVVVVAAAAVVVVVVAVAVAVAVAVVVAVAVAVVAAVIRLVVYHYCNKYKNVPLLVWYSNS